MLVRIVLPGTVFPDKDPAAKVQIAKVIESAEDITSSTPNEAVQKGQPPPLKKRRPMMHRKK